MKGQTTVKEFPEANAAQKALDKAVADKTKEGYVESSPEKTNATGFTSQRKPDLPQEDDRWNSKQLFELATESEDGKRLFASHSSSAPILVSLAQDDDETIRACVVGNPNTPAEVLTVLAEDDDVYVRSGVAGNSNTPPKALAMLAEEAEEMVRQDLAQNPLAPVEALSILARDDDDLVRRHVVGNPCRCQPSTPGLD